MDKKILNSLNKWLDSNLISESTYRDILNYEEDLNPSQKSKVAKAITLIGSLFLLSGLLGTLPLIWDNLTYWAQLLLLIVTTIFLIYSANYSERFEDKNFEIVFKFVQLETECPDKTGAKYIPLLLLVLKNIK